MIRRVIKWSLIRAVGFWGCLSPSFLSAAPRYDVTSERFVPVGFAAQHAKKRWVTYRSFNKELERTGEFGAMGVTNRCFFAANTMNSGGRPYCEYPLIWKGHGRYDWAALDAQVGDLLKASSNARLMCMIDLNTPGWATREFGLDSFSDLTHAACDPLWFSKTEKWMLDFIAYAERRWGDRIGAYVLSGGGTSEWYEYDRGRTSANKDAAWVNWCKSRGFPCVQKTVPPRPSLSEAAFENLVYDPSVEPEKIEYWKFHNSLPADALLGFAKAARKAVPKSKEIGAFFGYFLVSDNRHTSFGHLDYERVYASSDIDFFIAPGNYSDRGIGGGSGSQLVDGTALRHGKRFLHEIDFGPHDQTAWGNGVWKTLEDDLAGNMREAAYAMSKNASYWWFDMWGSFYRNPDLRSRIAALTRAQENLPDAPSVAQVLLVADPESIYYLNERNPGERAFGEAMRNALSKTGAPYDTCSFGDLEAIDLAPYRLIVLNSTLLITPEREKLLAQKVIEKGRTILWTYAPGLIDGKSIDTNRVEKFAGVPYKTPGVNITEMPGGWRSVYAHDYKLYTIEKLAEIEKLAGVHRYVDACTPVFAKENFVAVHTREGGKITVRLPRRAARVTDLLTGETVALDTDSFDATFQKPDTRLFKIDRAGEVSSSANDDLQTLVDGLIASGRNEITVPAGRYRMASSLVLSGLTNVTVDATGVELFRTSYGNALIVTNCSGLAVRGLEIDYDPLPWTQGRVLSVDENALTAEIELAEGYPDNDILPFKNQYFDCRTRELLDVTSASGFEMIGSKRIRAHWNKGARLPPLDALVVSNVAHPVMATFLKGPDDYSRQLHAVVQVDSRMTRFEDITVWASPWFSFFERDCDGTTYDHCRVDRRSEEEDPVRRGMPRLRASNSDAFHCTRAARGPKLRKCIARYMEDDGFNVHGLYHLVVSSQGKELRILDQGGMNLCPGDAVELLDDQGKLLPDARVVSVCPDNPDVVTSDELRRLKMRDLRPYFREHWRPRAYRVTLDRAEPLAFGSVIVSLAYAGGGFEVTDCTIGHTRARGVLARARDGLIVRNEITDTGRPAILLSSQPWWLEGGNPLGTHVESNRCFRCRADPPVQSRIAETRER